MEHQKENLELVKKNEELVKENEELELEIDELRARVHQLRDGLSEIDQVSCEAQDHLHLFKTRPECALLILEDYLKEIEEMCSI